jgi:hypothetical protein
MSLPSMLPADGRSNPVPVLTFRSVGNTAHAFTSTITSASAVRLGPFSKGTQVLSMHSNAAVWFLTGSSSVTATTSTGHFFPADLFYDFNVYWGGEFGAGGHQYISLITSDASKDASVHISERS